MRSDNTVLVGLGVGLAVLGVLSLVSLPFMLARIPTDYFTKPAAPAPRGSTHWYRRIVKNVLGWILLLLGIAMLVLPGQGLLTILVALILLDFPGKRRFELWLVRKPQVYRALNSLRMRTNRPPLSLPPAVNSSPKASHREHH